MNDEIKEILKEIECYRNEELCLIFLSQKKNNALLDYISNLENYKSRCEKAIEYIQKNAEEYLSVDMYYHLKDIPEIEDLLNILQNGGGKK